MDKNNSNINNINNFNSPEAAYLYGLGQSIQQLTQLNNGYFSTSTEDTRKKENMIDNLHKKAMAVIKESQSNPNNE